MLLKICGRKWAILIQKVGKWVVVGKRENSASGGRGIMSAGRVFRHRPPWAELWYMYNIFIIDIL